MIVSRGSDMVPVRIPVFQRPSFVDRLRLVASRRLLASLEPRAADFALAVMLGEGGGVPGSLRSRLADLGTAHVLAVSGLHIATAAAIFGFLIMYVLGPLLAMASPGINLTLVRYGIAVFAAVAVATIAGSTPSALRASIMIAVAVLAAVAGRRQGLEALAGIVGLCTLVIEPRDAFSLSFIMSYSAILGIAALTGPLANALLPERWFDEDKVSNKAAKVLVLGLCCSIAAFLATAPITLLAFGTAGIWGPVANLIVLPVMTFAVMPTALLTLFAATTSPAMLDIMAPTVGWLFGAFVDGQVGLADFLPAVTWTASRSLFCLAVSLPAALAMMLAGRAKTTGLIFGVCWAAVAGIHGPEPTDIPDDTLSVTFFDVGKGDSILVRCPTGRTYLVDTAEERTFEGRRGLAAKLRDSGVHELDGVVVTHGDEDHFGGLAPLSDVIHIGEVVASCGEATRSPLSGMLEHIATNGVQSRCVSAGMSALPECGARSPVLWPGHFYTGSGNAASLVFKLVWKGRSILMTGDIEGAQETELAASGVDLSADVLKLSHHGSRGASTQSFLDDVGPDFAIVSGHAARTNDVVPVEVRYRVDKAGARIYATSLHGDITVELSSDGLLVKTGGP